VQWDVQSVETIEPDRKKMQRVINIGIIDRLSKYAGKDSRNLSGVGKKEEEIMTVSGDSSSSESENLSPSCVNLNQGLY